MGSSTHRLTCVCEHTATVLFSIKNKTKNSQKAFFLRFHRLTSLNLLFISSFSNLFCLLFNHFVIDIYIDTFKFREAKSMRFLHFFNSHATENRVFEQVITESIEQTGKPSFLQGFFFSFLVVVECLFV